MWIFVGALLFLLVLYFWLLMGRAGHHCMQSLRGWGYAHRGLHDETKPENSMSAFRAALENGYGIELDVHLMADGNLAVIHDASLMRTAGVDVKIEDLTLADLSNYQLLGCNEGIPLFSQVLELFSGKAPMIVELKCERNNYAMLCQRVCDMLDSYKGVFCLESFDPRCIHWLRKNRPDLIRGQLSENWMRNRIQLPWYLKILMTFHLSHFYTRPDFIAYRFEDRKVFGTGICRKFWRITGVSWTLRSQEEYDTAVKEGWIPIFENFKP